jgi:hypothetical protein
MNAENARNIANKANEKIFDNDILNKILSDILVKSSNGFYSMQYSGFDNIPFNTNNSFIYEMKLKSLGYKCEFFMSNGGAYFFIGW